MIRVQDLVVRFGDVQGVVCPHLEIAAGERVGVVGPNGGGKSTLLRVLAGLLPPSSGQVQVPPPGRTVLVHQTPHLFLGTAADNVRYALRCAGRGTEDPQGWLTRLGVAPLAARRARDLSVGQRRRVAVARALAAQPEVLLLDEPLAGVDAEGEAALRTALEAFPGTVVLAAPALATGWVQRIVSLAP